MILMSPLLTIAFCSILCVWVFSLPIHLLGFLRALASFGSLLLLRCLLLSQIGWHDCVELPSKNIWCKNNCKMIDT